jgi:hypothetical protein
MLHLLRRHAFELKGLQKNCLKASKTEMYDSFDLLILLKERLK